MPKALSEVSNSQDFFDSRDAQERIDYLEALKERDEYDKAELKQLLQLKNDVDSSEWECGITFISEDYFEDYAREFAEDTGAIEKNYHWPANHIDWGKAADELKIDYTEVDFDGVAYYYR